MNRDFVEMLSVFSASGVEYLVVGAHALAVHASPLGGLSQDDFEIPGQVIQLGVVPNRIDLLTSITGVEFEDAWPRRQEVRIESLQVPILGREDLIRNKRATGRPQDRADLALLGADEDEAR